MLIQKQSETGAEVLRVRVEIPGGLAGKIRDYALAAGYGDDLAGLLVAATEYVISRDRDFRRRERGDSARPGRPRKKAATSPMPETKAEPPKPAEVAPSPVPAGVASQPERRGFFR